MDFKTFLEHFDAIAQAPNGIAKLRSLILDLAVRGKLVPQNPEDEPANKLLQRIQLSKERISSKKKVSKKKDFLPLDNDEVPFAVPKTWKWVRLHEICWLITDGTHHTPTYVDSGVPFLSVKDLSAGYLDFSNTRFVTAEAHKELCIRCKPEYGDILLTKVGTTGIAVEIDTNQEFNIFVSVALLKHFLAFTYPRFVRHLLNSPLVKKQSEDGTEGVGNKNLVLRKIYNFIIPLPPLAEQKRIVEKVDELMALCDRYQQSQEAQDKLRQKLRKSAITALMNAETDEELQKSWSIVRDNWRSLSQKPEDVGDLRRSILQLAVRGKLVSQSSEDEPVATLLARVSLLKKEVAKLEKLTKEEAFSSVEVDEYFYELPKGWTYIRLGEISFFLNGYAFKSNTYISTSMHQLVRLGNVKNDMILLDQNPVFISDDIASENQKFLIRENDLLITMTGTKGKRDFCFTAIARGNNDANNKKLYLNQRVGCIRVLSPISVELINIFLKSSNIVDFLLSTSTGTANQANVGVAAIRNLPIPLPPLAEQKRIVAKVDELMQMCDRLEESLRQTQQRAEALAASAINHLTV